MENSCVPKLLCKKCGIEKPITEFFKASDGNRLYGVKGPCKLCLRETYLKSQLKYREKRRAFFAQKAKEYRKANPLIDDIRRMHDMNKIVARRKARTALRRNKISFKACEVCGFGKSMIDIELHHDDYNKPLDIIFLCKKHHLELHRIQKRLAITFSKQPTDYPIKNIIKHAIM